MTLRPMYVLQWYLDHLGNMVKATRGPSTVSSGNLSEIVG